MKNDMPRPGKYMPPDCPAWRRVMRYAEYIRLHVAEELTVSEIAERLGVAVMTVHSGLRMAGCPIVHKGVRGRPQGSGIHGLLKNEPSAEAVRKLVDAGVRPSNIARAFGVSRQRIYQKVQKARKATHDPVATRT